MKIRTRLRIFCSVAFTVVFAAISLLTYSMFLRNGQRTVYENLEKSAYIIAFFFLEEDELSAADFAPIQRQFEENIPTSSYQIYDLKNRVAYGKQNYTLESTLLQEIREKGRIAFKHADQLCFGMFYRDNQGDFVVVAMEGNGTIADSLRNLIWILVVCFLIGITLIMLLSGWVAHRAYKPFTKTISQARLISAGNLGDLRLEVPDTDDELQSLIETFNGLLDKLSESFTVQKNFVAYVSHEFRTPLASMLMNLEVFGLKERTPEECLQLTENLTLRVKELEQILNTLLVVSDLREEREVGKSYRVDELLWEIIAKVKAVYPKSVISVNLDISAGEEDRLTVETDSMQLFVALFNLIENAVKFSNNQPVRINFEPFQSGMKLTIADQGIGIPEEKLNQLKTPFLRGKNAGSIDGNGLGLTLALRIFDKHKVHYQIKSAPRSGTIIELYFERTSLPEKGYGSEKAHR